MDVTDIIKDYLGKNGFDGLFNEDAECACKADDIAPCGELSASCEAGKLAPCDCGDGHDWHIVRVVPNAIDQGREPHSGEASPGATGYVSDD
jgi:hypothetical protein